MRQPAPATASIGTSSARVLAANARRRGLIIVNTSANTVSLGFGHAAVLASGVYLAGGATFTMDSFSFNTDAVYAIASAGITVLSVQEFE